MHILHGFSKLAGILPVSQMLIMLLPSMAGQVSYLVQGRTLRDFDLQLHGISCVLCMGIVF